MLRGCSVCFGRVVLYCNNTRRAAESDCPRKNVVVVARGVGRVPVRVLCLGFVRVPLLFDYRDMLFEHTKGYQLYKYIYNLTNFF